MAAECVVTAQVPDSPGSEPSKLSNSSVAFRSRCLAEALAALAHPPPVVKVPVNLSAAKIAAGQVAKRVRIQSDNRFICVLISRGHIIIFA